jgi:protoporphyrinogen/coproporphyrinogen III oxidase
MELNCEKQLIDIAIIGGGITGLAAAYEVKHWAEENNHPLISELFEESKTVGGKIVTDIIENEEGKFLLEQGPDSFLAQKPWALELAKQLGLKHELQETNSHQRHVFVLRRGQLRKIPDGMMLMVPTRFWPFVTTSVLSWSGKLRAAFEIFIPQKQNDEDESVAQFIQRRLGKEIFNYIGEPLLSGIYSADSSRQSLHATFPQFAEMEKIHGSLIRGMLSAPKNTNKSPFISFKNGMHTLVMALEKKLQGSIKLNSKIKSVILKDNELYQLILSNGQTRYAKAIIVTTPAISCANLLDIISPKASAYLRNLRVSPSGCIYFAFRKLDVDHSLKGFGFVVPASERRAINAITWVSSKLENRSPSGAILFRVFFGGHKNPNIMSKSDIEIDNIALQELKQTMKISVAPLFSKIYRNNHDNPQYEVGHLQQMEKIMSLLPQGIEVAGSAYGGVGIPDCVHQGRTKAKKAIEHILRKSSSLL